MTINSPTKSKKRFEENCKDIENLLYFHQLEGGDNRGRRDSSLEVLNKSAIVLICAFWEAYCEDIVTEAIEYIVNKASSANELGTTIKKTIAKEIKDDNHSKTWYWQKMSYEQAEKKLDEFITLRGSIAHRGKDVENVVKKQQVENFQNHVEYIVDKINEYIVSYLTKFGE